MSAINWNPSPRNDIWLDGWEEPLETQIDYLLQSTNQNKLRVPRLHGVKDNEIESCISEDGLTLVLTESSKAQITPDSVNDNQAKRDAYVLLLDPQNVSHAAYLKEEANKSQRAGERRANAGGLVGGALGFIGTTGYFLGNIGTTGQITLSYLISSGVGLSLGRITARGANKMREASLNAESQEATKSFISKNTVEIIPKAPTATKKFRETIMALVLRDPDSREFWREHAKPAIHKIVSYEQKVQNLAQNRANVPRGIEENGGDRYVLQFKEQQLLQALIKVSAKRRHGA